MADAPVERVSIDPRHGRFLGQVFAGVLLGFIGLLVVGVVAIPVYILRARRAESVELLTEHTDGGPELPSDEANPIESNPDGSVQTVQTGNTSTAMPKGVTWTNAEDAHSVTLGGIRVRVPRVEFGEVLARDERNLSTSAGPGEFLQVYLQIENRADAQLHYVSWYGNRFAFENQPVTARLWDDTGKLYPQQNFERSQTVHGHIYDATAPRGEQLRDVVIFAVPRQIVKDPARTLRLELPGGAVGTRFFYRFEIPRSMLNDF